MTGEPCAPAESSSEQSSRGPATGQASRPLLQPSRPVEKACMRVVDVMCGTCPRQTLRTAWATSKPHSGGRRSVDWSAGAGGSPLPTVDDSVGMSAEVAAQAASSASILDSLQRTVYPVLDQCYNLRGSVMNERGFLA